MNKYILKLLLLSIVCTLASCGHTVYVNQQGQSYNDYKAIKHEKVVNKTKKPKIKQKKITYIKNN